MSGQRLKHIYDVDERDDVHAYAQYFDELAAFLRDLL